MRAGEVWAGGVCAPQPSLRQHGAPLLAAASPTWRTHHPAAHCVGYESSITNSLFNNSQEGRYRHNTHSATMVSGPTASSAVLALTLKV